MHGATIIKNDAHERYAGGVRRDFDRAEVVAFGRHARYGDFVVRYQVRLIDGAEIMLNGTEQTEADRKWLRSLAKRTPWPRANRDVPQADAWIDITVPAASPPGPGEATPQGNEP